MWAPDDYVEADLLGVTEDGAIRAGADPAAYAALQIPNDPERSGPRFEGTLTEFQASHGGTEFAKEFAKNLASTGKTPTARESDFERQALDAQLHNLVRKCAACGKACGFTTTHCNGCNAELPQETVRTDNIFMSFVYGIAKGDRFPYDIAVRLQTRELLVFDDPLALSACHFCAIPTSCWAADWRLLLRAPMEGLALLTKLEEAAWSCMEEQFLSNEAWCARNLRGAPPTDATSRAALRSHVVCGCNFPPSQFQLHLQFFLMPWLPSHYKAFTAGVSLSRRRWFPLKYIKGLLGLNQPMAVELDTSLDEIFAVFDAQLSYDAAFEQEIARVAASHKALANWRPADFAAAVDGDAVVQGSMPEGQTAKGLLEADKKLLHSSGPVKTYYKFARTDRVPEFGKGGYRGLV